MMTVNENNADIIAMGVVKVGNSVLSEQIFCGIANENKFFFF